MSDHEDEFADTVEGPPYQLEDSDEEGQVKFGDVHEQEDVLQQAQESESRHEEADSDIIDDGHERSFEEAMKAKAEGNDFFRGKQYDDASEQYSKAIYFCPLGDEHKEQMAVFYGNRSACYASLEEHELVVADCSSALSLSPSYHKVRMRRCQAYESMEKYDEALADIKAILEEDKEYPKARITLTRLEKLYAEKMDKMKDEALGKLKDLGNSILGNFGMSLDNFKMQQDPQSGSWSVNMK